MTVIPSNLAGIFCKVIKTNLFLNLFPYIHVIGTESAMIGGLLKEEKAFAIMKRNQNSLSGLRKAFCLMKPCMD